VDAQKRYTIIVLIILVISVGCSRQQVSSIESRNLSFLYKPSATTFHPQFMIYHRTDTTSLLFIKLYINELAQIYDEKKNNNYFKIRFQYQIFSSGETEKFLDSSSVILKSYQPVANSNFVTYIPLKLKKGGKYFVEIVSTDMINNRKNQDFIRVDKENNYSMQNFLITNVENLKPVFNNVINSSQVFSINNLRNKSKNIFIKYYSANIPSPMPPFYIINSKTLNIAPDSIWEVKNYSEKKFILENKGLYYLQTDTTLNQGLALYNYSKYFPYVKSAENLLDPLIYLTSFREFKDMKAYKNQKIAVDSFWLNTADDMDKARELIRVYYNRVQLANKYFTSYTQGWNTDRGMIFVVLGPPKNVIKSSNMERWSYGHRISKPVLEFSFVLNETPFTNNSYSLQRDELYSQIWNQAVDTWRSGLVFSIAE